MMSAVVAIPPGTHHVKFLVDGEMTTSPSLPTAVDDTGILVNYLEVSADDMPLLNRQLTPGGSAHPGNPRAPDSSDRVPPIFPAESQLHYTTEIPSYLKEYVDSPYDEDNANGYAEGAPSPPSLPMMLQKVILNDNSQKDDASVLNSPNHAVLNHLATSSIKNSILAVSATTRYKKKVWSLPLLVCWSSTDRCTHSMSQLFCTRPPLRTMTSGI